MDLFLIRHAHAEDTVPDRARRLSERGRTQVADLAKFLRRSGAFAPQEIWHSTLVRARETAELLAADLKLDAPRRELAGLAPEDDPSALLKKIAAGPASLAIIGHEPFLSALGTLLVVGRETGLPKIAMKKGAVLALEGGGEWWTVRWHVWPGLVA